MKTKKLILTITVLSIAVLALAACDATGAVPLSDLVGENATNNSTNDQTSEDAALKSASKMEDSQDASPTEEPNDSIKLTGMVEAVTENSITINGTTFVVNSPVDLTTLFEVGMAYQFEYYLNTDGSITVDSFSLDDGTSDDMMDGEELKFQGMLEDVTETTLTFDGVTYTVDTQEDLTMLFVAGQMYEIEYYLNADGSITLKDFSLEDMSSGSSNEVYTDSSDDSSDDSSSNDSYNNSSDDDSYDDNSSNDSYDNSSDDSYDDSSNDSSNNSEDDSNNENNHENNFEDNSENNG